VKSIDVRFGIADVPNWDSYGGAPTTDEAIATASAIVGVPTCNGGYQLELHAGSASVEIVIGPDGFVMAVSFERRMVWTQDMLDAAKARAERLIAFLNPPVDGRGSGAESPKPEPNQGHAAESSHPVTLQNKRLP
jgi:hypothetical protein